LKRRIPKSIDEAIQISQQLIPPNFHRGQRRNTPKIPPLPKIGELLPLIPILTALGALGGHHFRGGFMRDHFPEKPWINECGIIHLDNESGKGTYWGFQEWKL